MFRHFVVPREKLGNVARAAGLLLLVSILAIPVANARSTQEIGRVRFTWDANPEPIVTGYRIHWGNEPGVYTETRDVGNVTEVVIEEFFDGVSYYSAITAYADSGEESDFSEEISFVWQAQTPVDPDFVSSAHLVSLQAENGVLTAPMSIASDGEATWVENPTGGPAAATLLNFTLPRDGSYYLWYRTRSPAGVIESLQISLDGGEESELRLPIGEGGDIPHSGLSALILPAEEGWNWNRIESPNGKAQSHLLATGAHTLRVRFEGGSLLDRIFLASDPAFIPTDDLPQEGDIVAVVGQPEDRTARLGGSVTLSADFISTAPVKCQWSRNGSAVPGATGPTLTLDSVSEADAGNYMVSVWTDFTVAISQAALLTVLPPIAGGDFRIGSMSVAGDGQVMFELEGLTTAQVRVYGSDDLVNWDLISSQSGITGSVTITDPEATGAGKRYYRLDDGQP